MDVGMVAVRQPLAESIEPTAMAFRRDPGRWLPAPARRRGGDRWTVTLRAGPLSRSVACTIGPVWEVEGTAWRRVEWRPEEERGDSVPVVGLLPVLNGEIGLRQEGGRAVLVLNGTYDPPVGVVGSVADQLVGRHVARATARRFLEAVAARLANPSPGPRHDGLRETWDRYSSSRSSRARRSAR